MSEPRLFDQDALLACTDLVGRTGAKGFEIGYVHDDAPTDQAGWYATAVYRGAKVIADDHPGPLEAAEALAVRLLTGAKCKCGKLVALGPDGAFAFFDAPMADGSRWTAAQAAAAGQCRWRRVGSRWFRGCENRAQRRQPR